MKKTMAVILALCLTLSTALTMTPIRSQAAEKEEASTPEDAFDGEYVEFEGSDGSKTLVYDNGSVMTLYADGSSEGVDYKGNQYDNGADGVNNVRLTDGTIATEYPDGTMALTEPDGRTTTVRPDGTFSESFASLGLTIDYNADGGKVGIGFTGSSERIPVNEDGDYENGELTGPNGEILKFTEDGSYVKCTDGKIAEYKCDGDNESIEITHPDGSKGSFDLKSTWKTDADGNRVRVEETSGSITHPDGSKYEMDQSITYDADGNPVYSDHNVQQWTDADGKTLWMDGNSKALEYTDPVTGEVFRVDDKGNLTELKSDQVNWDVKYDENGNVISANVTYDDGTTLTVDENGRATFVTPEGTYVSDGEGNVWKDGTLIKENGTWVPGYESEGVESSGSEGTEPSGTGFESTDGGTTESEDTGSGGTDWGGGSGNPFDDGPIYIGPDDHVSVDDLEMPSVTFEEYYPD